MINILVTGGAGFIGSNFIRFLLRAEPNCNIINLDALTYSGSLSNLRDVSKSSRYEFVHGNICNFDLVDNLIKNKDISKIIHFAAESHVDRSIIGPKAFIETNIVGTFTLLEAARKNWLINGSQTSEYRFHHVSTDEVFGSLMKSEPGFSESTAYRPSSPYSASKAASDHLVRSYWKTYGLPITITNCSNNYGPYQYPEKFIPLVLLNAIRGKNLPIYGDGQQIRDWLFVEDHCEAIWMVIKKGKIGETYNVGGENQPTNLDILELICKLLDKKIPDSPNLPHISLLQFVKDRPGHDQRYAMNIKKIENELGWKPRHRLEDGLEETVNWYLANTEWVREISTGTELASWLEKNYRYRGGAD